MEKTGLDLRKKRVLEAFGVTPPMAKALRAYCMKMGVLTGSRCMGVDSPGADWDYVVSEKELLESGLMGIPGVISRAHQYSEDHPFIVSTFYIGDDKYDMIIAKTGAEKLAWMSTTLAMKAVMRIHPMKIVLQKDKRIRTDLFEAMREAAGDQG